MPELTPTHELTIRQAIADTLAPVTDAGYIQPSPLYLSDISDFWATFDPSQNTKSEIDAARVAGLWIYPIRFEDDPTSGCPDNPAVKLTYELYLFRQYALTRANDATPSMQIFDEQVLVHHNKFISAWLGIKAALQGNRSLGLDSNVFALNDTTSVVQIDNIQNLAICDFVPSAAGFVVRLQETVNILLK